MIESVRNQYLRDGLKSKTINRVMTIIRLIIRFALEQGELYQNPIRKSLYLKDEAKQFSYFEKEEIHALLRSSRELSSFPVLFLAVNTGMRLGELLGLCWDRVNFNSNKIEITRTLHAKGILQEKTKSGKARYFPINENVRSFLLQLKAKSTGTGFVFTNQNGDPFNPDHFSGRNFKRACKRAKVRCLRFHDLRHSYASHFMMNGGTIFELREMLGHSDIKTTMIYAHLSQEHLKDASKKVNFGVFNEEKKENGPFLALVGN